MSRSRYWTAPEKKSPTEITDESTMYFGVHKGKPVAHLPAEYLLWLWEQEWFTVTTHTGLWNYINNNINTLIEWKTI